MIRFTLRKTPHVPLEAEVLSPQRTATASQSEIAALPLFLGKKECRLDEFFEVEGERSDQLEILGDAANVKWIGRGMTGGSIRVIGNAGMHLGAYMKGGSIEVTGNASDWVGAEMKSGFIKIGGNAGGQIGGAYRGSLSGMSGGTIIIGGTVGLEIGMRMKRGTIVVGGRARDFVGLQMKGGTIVLMQGAEIRTGAWMKRGTIISLSSIEMLPTFLPSCSFNPTFVPVLARQLKPLGIDLPYRLDQGAYQLYTGDSAVPGSGEILVWQAVAG